MAPMIATVSEAADFAAAARAAGIETVGVMVEVPAIALRARDVLAEVDFVSIGTNDLAQYTMATDRLRGELVDLLDMWQPALLDLVAVTAEAGAELGKPVGVCGESAADPVMALVLTGVGVTSLSMSPAAVPGVRFALRAHTLAHVPGDGRRGPRGAHRRRGPRGGPCPGRAARPRGPRPGLTHRDQGTPADPTAVIKEFVPTRTAVINELPVPAREHGSSITTTAGSGRRAAAAASRAPGCADQPSGCSSASRRAPSRSAPRVTSGSSCAPVGRGLPQADVGGQRVAQADPAARCPASAPPLRTYISTGSAGHR